MAFQTYAGITDQFNFPSALMPVAVTVDGISVPFTATPGGFALNTPLSAPAVVEVDGDIRGISGGSGGLTNGELRGSPVPVSGALTDAQLRASAVPVSGALTDAQLRASAVPVSGALTDAQLRASAVPVSVPGVSASGAIAALNANVALGLAGATGFAVDVRGTFVGTLTIQGTINDIDYFTISVIPAGGGVNVAALTTVTAPGAWMGSANGMVRVRVIFTAYTSGTATVVVRAMQAAGLVNTFPTGAANQTVNVASGTVSTVSALTGGGAAEDAAAGTNPVVVGGVVRDTNASVTLIAGDAVRQTMTRGAAAVVKPFAVAEAGWNGTQLLTTTTAAQIVAAAAAGLKRNVTALQAMNTGAAAVELIILDGGTERWRFPLPINVPVCFEFPTELVASAATAVNVNLSATNTGVRVNLQGYTSA